MVLMFLLVPVLSFAEEITIPIDEKPYYIVLSSSDAITILRSDVKAYISTDNRIVIHQTNINKYYYPNGTTTPEYTVKDNYSNYLATYTIISSNYDVFFNETTDVFFSPPKVSPLTQVTQTISPKMILTNILVGLPLVLGLVILVLAFRKAWAFLHSQLTH